MRTSLVSASTILISLLLVACTSSSDDSTTPTPSSTAATTESPTPTPTPSPTPDPEADFPELTPFSADLEARLHEIRDRVADIRGLPVHSSAQEGLVTREALAQYGRDQFAALEGEDAEDVEAAEAMLSLLGLVPPGYSFEDYAAEQANITEGVYYFEADRLVLVGEAPDELSVSEELTLAHEYTHSMQDEQHDLGTLTDRWVESDAEEAGFTAYSETLRCLIEGDAELTLRLYAESVYGPNWEDLVAAEYDQSEPIDVDIPEFLLRAFYFNYGDCVVFVEMLYEDGGWDAVNAAYEDPPGTTEQIILIDKYYAGELAGQPKPESIDDQLDGWSEVPTLGGQFGLYDIYNYVLSRSGDPYGGAIAAGGWDHGWIRAFRADGEDLRVAVDLTLGWDTFADRTGFMEAFDGVLESHGLGLSDVAVNGNTRRWHTQDEFDQHGAMILDDAAPGLRIIFATDEEALEMFLPSD